MDRVGSQLLVQSNAATARRVASQLAAPSHNSQQHGALQANGVAHCDGLSSSSRLSSPRQAALAVGTSVTGLGPGDHTQDHRTPHAQRPAAPTRPASVQHGSGAARRRPALNEVAWVVPSARQQLGARRPPGMACTCHGLAAHIASHAWQRCVLHHAKGHAMHARGTSVSTTPTHCYRPCPPCNASNTGGRVRQLVSGRTRGFSSTQTQLLTTLSRPSHPPAKKHSRHNSRPAGQSAGPPIMVP